MDSICRQENNDFLIECQAPKYDKHFGTLWNYNSLIFVANTLRLLLRTPSRSIDGPEDDNFKLSSYLITFCTSFKQYFLTLKGTPFIAYYIMSTSLNYVTFNNILLYKNVFIRECALKLKRYPYFILCT